MGSATTTYANTPSGPLAQKVTSGKTTTVRYYLRDPHGDVVGVSDTSGALKGTALYDPWGQILSGTGELGTLPVQGGFRFQSDLMDASTGQLDMGARWYEPSLGRFSTPDPIMGELTSPLSLNRYLYGLGSPLTHTDPTGLSVRPPESGGGHCGPACMNHVLGDQPSSHHGPGVRRGEQMTPEEAFEAGYRYDSVTDSWYDPCAGVPCSSWDPTDELWGAFKFLVLDDIAACLGGSAVSCAAFLPWGKVLKPFKALKYLRFGDEAAQYGDEVAGVVRHSPVNPGPLADEIAATFRGGSYSSITLSTDVVLYRSWGGRAGELGQYWTRTRPTGPLQSQLDSALDPAWGNTAERVAVIRVPAGTTIYQGAAAPQRIAGGGSLLGGGSQVFIPHVDPSWLV